MCSVVIVTITGLVAQPVFMCQFQVLNRTITGDFSLSVEMWEIANVSCLLEVLDTRKLCENCLLDENIWR